MREIKRQAISKTSGINRTTPGLQKRPNNEKIPVQIYGRVWRDPRSLDLVQIEKAADQAKMVVEELSQKAKDEIAKNQKAKKQAEIEQAVQKALELKEKGGEDQ